jgi:hypothetical protein
MVLGGLVDEIRAEREAAKRLEAAMRGGDPELARFLAAVIVASRLSLKPSVSCAETLSPVMPTGPGLDRRALGRLDERPMPGREWLLAALSADAREPWREEAFSRIRAMAVSDPSGLLGIIAAAWGLGDARGGFAGCETCDADTKLENAYRILGLKPGSGALAARKVYRELTKRFHPDALEGLGAERVEAAKEAFIRIEAAYRAVAGAEGAPSNRPAGESWRRGPEASR